MSSLRVWACGAALFLVSTVFPLMAWSQSDLDQKLAALYAEAAKEGEVVFYTGDSDASSSKLSQFWKAHFPKVKLTLLHKQSPDIVNDIEAERAAGQVRADVVCMALPYIAAIWKGKGVYAPYKPASFAALGKDDKDPDGAYIVTGVYVLGPAYNSKSIADKGQLPKRMADFLDPKWTEKMVVADPRTAGQTKTFFMAMLLNGKLDWPYMERLAKQKIMITRTNPDAARMLAAGERVLSPMVSSQNVLIARERGQAIDFYTAEEGSVVGADVAGIMAGSKHPHAAKLLQEVLTSAEGQEIVTSNEKMWPTHPDAKLPPNVQKLSELHTLRVDLKFLADEKSSSEFLQRFDTTFGRN
jgi:iron(III) transport system substrate-binding protein